MYPDSYRGDLGRFYGADPLAGTQPGWTPYHYAYNNLCSFTDPTGLTPECASGDPSNYSCRGGKYKGGNYAYGSSDFNNGSRGADGLTGREWLAYSRPTGISAAEVMSFKAGEQMSGTGSYGAAATNAVINWVNNVLAAGGGKLTMAGGGFWVEDATTSNSTEIINGETVVIVGGIRSVWVSTEQNWWFDKQGEQLFNHWRNGGGAELILNSREWGDYMLQRGELGSQIQQEIAKKKVNGNTQFSGRMHGQLDVPNLYRTGHQMLNGSNSRVGDLQYSVSVEFFKNFEGGGRTAHYYVDLIWNDIIDPNQNYFMDKVGSSLFPGTNYTVRIGWSYYFTLHYD